MHELAMDEVGQVSGGQSSGSTPTKGIVVDDLVLVPSPGPVAPSLS